MEEEDHNCSSCCVICCDDAEEEETDLVCPICNDCDVKDKLSELKSNISTCVDNLNKSGENEKRLEDLMSHIDKVINLTRKYKTEGLISSSMEKFIETCKEVKEKMENLVNSEPPCVVCKKPPKCSCDKANLASSASSSKCPTCSKNMPEVAPCDACKKPPECTCNKTNLASSTSSSKCPTCLKNMPIEPPCDACKKPPDCTCNKANLASSASSSKCPMYSTNMPIEPPCDACKKPPECTCNKANLASSASSSKCPTCSTNIPEDAPCDACKKPLECTCNKANLASSASSSKCPTCSTNMPIEPPCDACKKPPECSCNTANLASSASSSKCPMCSTNMPEDAPCEACKKTTDCSCNKANLVMSADSSKCVDPTCPTKLPTEESPCSDSTYNLTDMSCNKIGYFEKKFKEIVKVTRFKNEDGSIGEEKQVITIKTETRNPNQTKGIDSKNDENEQCCDFSVSEGKGQVDNKSSSNICKPKPWETKSEHATGSQQTCEAKFRSCLSASQSKEIMNKDSNASKNPCVPCYPATEDLKSPPVECLKGCPNQTTSLQSSNASQSTIPVSKKASKSKPGKTVSVKKPKKDKSNSCLPCQSDDKANKNKSVSTEALWRDAWTSTTGLLCIPSCIPNKKPSCPRCTGKDRKAEPSSNCCTIPSTIANTKPNLAKGTSNSCPQCTGIERKPEPSSNCCNASSNITNTKSNLTKGTSKGCPVCTERERKAESCSSHCTNSCSTPNMKPNTANGTSKGCPKCKEKERKPEPSSSCCTVKIISKPAKTCCSQKKVKPNQDPHELVLSILDTIKKTYIPSNSALKDSSVKLQNICKSCRSKLSSMSPSKNCEAEEEQESEILSTSGNSSYMSMSCKSVGVGSAASNGQCRVCNKLSTPSVKSQKKVCCSSRRNSEESSGETRCKIAQPTIKSACCSPKKPSSTSCRPKKSSGSMKCKPTCITIRDVGTTTRRSTRYDVRPVTRPPTPKKVNLNDCTCHSESHFPRNKTQREPARGSMSYDHEYFCKW